VLTLNAPDTSALNLWVNTYEITVGDGWFPLPDAPSYQRCVALATPIVAPGDAHPNLIIQVGPTSTGGVQIRAVGANRRLVSPPTLKVQVLMAEHRGGGYPIYDEMDMTNAIGLLVVSRRESNMRIHSTRVLDRPNTPDKNEWLDWIKSWHDAGEDHVMGAWSTDRAPHEGFFNNAIVGQPWVPEDFRAAASVFWASGGDPTTTVGPGWTRAGQTAGVRIHDTRGPFGLSSELSTIRVEAPEDQIRLGDSGMTLRAATVSTANSNPAAPPGQYVFASPAKLTYNTEVWWPAVTEAADTTKQALFNGREGLVDVGFLTVSPAVPAPATSITLPAASRFLAQATFGARSAEVSRVQQMGMQAWLTEQATITAGAHQPEDATVDLGTEGNPNRVTAYQFDPSEHHPYSRTKPHMDDLYLFWEGYLKKHWNPPPVGAGTAVALAAGARDYRIPYEAQGGWRTPRGGNAATQWMRNIVRNDDQLRQRVAFALSQIFVVSTVPDPKQGMAMARYQDALVGHAFGRFRDLLRAVTFSPLMAFYLTYIGATNGAADENYARELMQLFTIGLWQLHPDGTYVLEGDGANTARVPTYSNTDIEDLSKVFTGFTYNASVQAPGQNRGNILSLDAGFISWAAGSASKSFLGFCDVVGQTSLHDWSPKSVLGRPIELPVGRTDADMFLEVENALDILLEHPNVAPFFAKAMIRLLVKSNPSPEYVGRVADVFRAANNTFADQRTGNDNPEADNQLFQVVEAVLLDVEARTAGVDGGDATHGKLQEPVVRMTRMVKALDADLQVVPPRPVFSASDFLPRDEVNATVIQSHSSSMWPAPSSGGVEHPSSNHIFNALESDFRFRLHFGAVTKRFGQWPFASPSVFNFYDANYAHPELDSGPNQLVSPEFGLLHSASVVDFPNFLREQLEVGITLPPSNLAPGRLEFSEPLAQLDQCLTSNPQTLEPLMSWLELVICNGNLGVTSRYIVEQAIPDDWRSISRSDTATMTTVVKNALWAAAISPDGAVLR